MVVDLNTEPEILDVYGKPDKGPIIHLKSGQFTWNSSQLVREYFDMTIEEALQKIEERRKPNVNLLLFLLKNQHLIPEEWQRNAGGYKYELLFLGSVFQVSYANSVMGMSYSYGFGWLTCHVFVHRKLGEFQQVLLFR